MTYAITAIVLGLLGVGVVFAIKYRDRWTGAALSKLERDEKPDAIDEQWEEQEFGEGGRQ
jgi:hypothetical protein